MNAWKGIPGLVIVLLSVTCLYGCGQWQHNQNTGGDAGNPGDGPPLSKARGKFMPDLNYEQDGPGSSHKMDLAVPEGTGPFPVVVWIHGGAWMQGDKFDCPAAFLVDNGFAVASINYRFSKQAAFPAQILDCKSAVRWLRANSAAYKLDGKRIGVWGASAGGHLAAMLGTTSDTADFGPNDGSSAVSAVCDWCGPADLATLKEQCGPNWGLDLQSDHAVHYLLAGGFDSRLLLKASPITYVHSGIPPFLILHGDSDNVIPLAQSEELAEALKLAGVENTFVIVKGAGHSFGTKENFDQVLSFFKAKLSSPKMGG
jgi:acetyl esterase/lipase